ncbi:MAG: hypothetical protein HY815_07370, partial [Candidatus Riflebacteria bacterium]|nr:hypothetical protein [Candidatus Riflebacteria bacterium]
MHDLVRRNAAVWATLLVVLAGPLAAQDGSKMSALDLNSSIRALNYEMLKDREKEIPRAISGFHTQKDVVEKLTDLRMHGTAERVAESRQKDPDRRQPYRHFLPALCGATGLIDMPVAYTQPKKKYVVSAQTEHLQATDRYWSLPYKSVNGDSRYWTLNYGATHNIEVNADVEFWNKDFQYNDPLNGTNPSFSLHDKFFFGFGSKWAFPLPGTTFERLWFAMGFRVQFFNNPDRNVTEFHEYERHSHVYWA